MLSTGSAINRRLAIAGLGLTLACDAYLFDELERGELVSILEQFCAPFPGYHLYYPQRRQASPALSAFIDYLLQWRQKKATRRRGRTGGRGKKRE